MNVFSNYPNYFMIYTYTYTYLHIKATIDPHLLNIPTSSIKFLKLRTTCKIYYIRVLFTILLTQFNHSLLASECNCLVFLLSVLLFECVMDSEVFMKLILQFLKIC